MTINNDNVFTDESFAPIATVPSTLTADQLVELHDAQQDEGAVHTQGTAYQRSRALAYRNRHRFVASVSPAALAYHVEKVMDYKVDGLRLTGIDREYQIAAMGILQLDVLRTVTKSDKADQNNRISDLRRALESLNHFASAIKDMTDDEFVTWFAGKGGLDGIHREFREANPVEVEPVRDDKKIRTAIEAMIANSNAVEVDNPGLATGIRLFVARGEGGKLRMVPLDASADFIASLSDRAPDPMCVCVGLPHELREHLLQDGRLDDIVIQNCGVIAVMLAACTIAAQLAVGLASIVDDLSADLCVFLHGIRGVAEVSAAATLFADDHLTEQVAVAEHLNVGLVALPHRQRRLCPVPFFGGHGLWVIIRGERGAVAGHVFTQHCALGQ